MLQGGSELGGVLVPEDLDLGLCLLAVAGGLLARGAGGGLGGAGGGALGVEGLGYGAGLLGGLGALGAGGGGGGLGAAAGGLCVGELGADPGRAERLVLLAGCLDQCGGLPVHGLQGGERVLVAGGVRDVRRGGDAHVVVVAAGAALAAVDAAAVVRGQGLAAAGPPAGRSRLVRAGAGGGAGSGDGAGHGGASRLRGFLFISDLRRNEKK